MKEEPVKIYHLLSISVKVRCPLLVFLSCDESYQLFNSVELRVYKALCYQISLFHQFPYVRSLDERGQSVRLRLFTQGVVEPNKLKIFEVMIIKVICTSYDQLRENRKKSYFTG